MTDPGSTPPRDYVITARMTKEDGALLKRATLAEPPPAKGARSLNNWCVSTLTSEAKKLLDAQAIRDQKLVKLGTLGLPPEAARQVLEVCCPTLTENARRQAELSATRDQEANDSERRNREQALAKEET